MESHGVVPGAIDVIDPETLEIRLSIEVGLQATGVDVISPASTESEQGRGP
jgi:hypothetical protein